MANFREKIITLADGAQLDAFNKLRVSEAYTQLDVKQSGNERPELLDVIETAGGTRTYLPNESASDLAVTTTGDRVVLQSKRYGFYQAGKSLLTQQTGTLTTNSTNSIVRIGYFDDHTDKTVDSRGNGFFFYHNNGIFGVCERSYVTGAQVDTAVVQANWNLDVMDGSGISGKTFVGNKTNIFVVDGQWLGVGRVRLGLVIDGILYYVHQFVHAGINDTTYTTTFDLPLRWEIESFGGADSMKAICGSIQSEGGFEPLGVPMSVNTGVASITNNTTVKQLIAIRSKDAFARTSLNPLNISVLLDSGNPSIFSVYLCDTTTGGTWVDTGSASESNLGVTTFTGRLISTFYSSANNRQGLANLKDLIYTGSDIDGTQQTILITGYAPAGNSNCWVGIDYQEIR